jgi:hypothetical protein
MARLRPFPEGFDAASTIRQMRDGRADRTLHVVDDARG